MKPSDKIGRFACSRERQDGKNPATYTIKIVDVLDYLDDHHAKLEQLAERLETAAGSPYGNADTERWLRYAATAVREAIS